MNLKKKIVLLFIILLILLSSIIAFISFSEKNMKPEKALKKFTREIEKGSLKNMSLEIYYFKSLTFTPYTFTSKDLINGLNVTKVIINGNELEKNIEVLRQISEDSLIPLEQNSLIDARIYYVFKNKRGRKIFDVTMWGSNDSIFVNEYEFEGTDIFYDILMPFLPEGDAKYIKDLQEHINKIKQETMIDNNSQE